MTVYLVTSLPNMPYIHRIYMVLANPSHIAQHLITMMGVMRIRVPLLPVRALNDGGHAHLCALAPSARSQ